MRHFAGPSCSDPWPGQAVLHLGWDPSAPPATCLLVTATSKRR